MPAIGQQGKDFFSYQALFDSLNQIVQARHTAFNRAHDIARKHLRQIVKQTAEEISHNALVART